MGIKVIQFILLYLFLHLDCLCHYLTFFTNTNKLIPLLTPKMNIHIVYIHFAQLNMISIIQTKIYMCRILNQ